MSITIGASRPERNILCCDPIAPSTAQKTHAQIARQAPFQSSDHTRKMQCVPAKYCRGKSGLSRVELALLAYVLEHPEPWQQGPRKEIADDCGCAANSIPRAARTLIRLQLIETVPGGGSVNTIYSLGRNMQVTESDDTRNTHVSRNVEDTTPVTSELRAASSAAEAETNTTGGVVTTLRGGRNIPPPHPPINTSSVDEGSPEPTESSFDRGLGGEDLFGADGEKPKRKTKRKPKRLATEETMPTEPSRKMLEHAATNKFVNGTVARMFDKWRDHHIAKATPIADYEASWRTWVGNAIEFRSRDEGKARKGYTSLGIGPDGEERWARDHRTNVYR